MPGKESFLLILWNLPSLGQPKREKINNDENKHSWQFQTEERGNFDSESGGP